ncbi:MAG: hypothetical protein J6S44_03775 [Clostridia bacterium]|nr:hypothetical protein [Clostridia bacterium]
MKIKNLLLELISRACIICVAVSLLFFVVAKIVTANTVGGELGISFSQYGLFALFSLLLAAASYLFRLPLSKALCFLIHYVATGASFFIMFAIAGKLTAKSFGGAMVFFALFTLLYAVFFGVYLLFKRLLFPEAFPKKKGAEDYKKRF